ncbi:MAG: NUDIX domain-containing protein [Burkholderiaceae bacterium]|nr:NUDIX domain-containing protein [Burkholderiaceae bacterium]
MSASEPGWLSQLRARAEQPPRRPRDALFIAGCASPVGSIEPGLADRLRADGLPISANGEGWQIAGAADSALGEVARHLSAHGLCGKWRNELLAVTDDTLRRLAVIERAAVRPLGIATFAVHLIGFTPQGWVWVQQRALDKATDPGQWDTLVGGLVAADESEALALERETWEEAGLRTDALHGLAKVDRISVRRPVREGYMVEHIDVFEAVVPEGMAPVNQDGEVARFDCMKSDDLIERLAADAFTLEAGLILARSLARHGQRV